MARRGFIASIPERLLRSLAAVIGGALHESGTLILPRFVRQSRLYEATAKNLLRVLVEGVGAVEGASTKQEDGPEPGQIVKRKVAGNVVELGSIAAFGFSPLWILAAASDVVHGSRTYLDTFVRELKAKGVIESGATFETVDDLLAALEGGSGTTARLIDMPPLEVEAMRDTLTEFRSHASELPSQDEMAAVYTSLRRTAEKEHRPLLDVSTGVGLAFLTATRSIGRDHVAGPYAEDWEPLRKEGFAKYAKRISRPYGQAVGKHFDGEQRTYTERVLGRLSRDG